MRLLFVLSTIAIGGFVACTSDDAPPAPAATPDGGGGGGSEGGAPRTSSSGGPGPSTDAGTDSGGAAAAGSVRVEDNGTSYDLTVGGAVTAAGNGLKYGAASTAGGQLRALSIILRYVVHDASGDHPDTPIVGKYRCDDKLAPTAEKPSFSAVVQYSTPQGIYQSDYMAATNHCDVDLTQMGPVGATAKGSFTANLPMVGKPQQTIAISGSFDLTRQQ